MIKTDANKQTLAAIRKAERAAKEAAIKEQCERLAIERYGEERIIKQLSNNSGGIWYLPMFDEDETTIEKLAILKPIDRHILSYASTKIEGEGLYAFLESCMRECFLEGDREILDDDNYFIPAANVFNKILEGKKAYLLKR